jgi:hypothetical protein
MLWVYGSTFESYDNLKFILDPKQAKQAKLETLQPFQAHFNSFHNFVWVQNAN